MSDFLEEFCLHFAVWIFMVCVVVFIVGIFKWIDMSLNQADCMAIVDNKIVYSGACNKISISSIGENGNTKRLSIGKGLFALIKDKEYVNENIKIEALGE